MFDSITVDKDMSAKDAYVEFLKNFAISAGEKTQKNYPQTIWIRSTPEK